MKQMTIKWLKGWGFILLGALGIPTLGFTFFLIHEYFSWKGWNYIWQYTCLCAIEDWLDFWRKLLLLIAGFPTLGYAWLIVGKIWDSSVYFSTLETKYRKERQAKEVHSG